LPVDLPDGVQLESLSVTAKREATLRVMYAELGCVALNTPDASPISLAKISVQGGDGNVHTDSANLSPAGSNDPNLVASLGKVDISKYRYFISVSLEESRQGKEHARIYAFQISYGMP
jgi:hypothetical protein